LAVTRRSAACLQVRRRHGGCSGDGSPTDGCSLEELAQIRPFIGTFGRFLPPLMAANALLRLGYLLFVKKSCRRGQPTRLP
jgi:hypothetical protein